MAGFFPIRELSAYHQKWTIKARVASKGQLREFNRPNSPNGKGNVFSVDLIDQTGTIKGTFFNAAADKFFGMLQQGNVYTFSRANIKVANKKFNNTGHPYEITFEESADIKEATDDKSIDTIRYNFVDLRTVQAKQLPSSADLCVIVKSHKPLVTFQSKAGDELTKRELVVCDNTEFSMDITIWGEQAMKLKDSELDGSPVIALKSVALKEWNERSGSLSGNGSLAIEPNLPEAAKLRTWWKDMGGASKELKSLSNSNFQATGGRKIESKQMSIADMKAASNLVGETPEYYTVQGCRLMHVITKKQGEDVPVYYNACQRKVERNGRMGPCNKKVDMGGHCPMCGGDVQVSARYNVRCRFADFTDAFFVNLFEMEGETVFGRPAEGFKKDEKEGKKPEVFIGSKVLERPFELILMSKIESYQGEQRSNTRCVKARPLSYSEHGKTMIGEIYDMMKQGAKAVA